MKKLIKNIVLIPALALGLSSCTDWLELKPTTVTVEEDMWKDQSDVEAVVASCYNAMLSNSFMQRVIAYGELRGDNLTYNKTSHNDLGTAGREMYKSISLSSITSTDDITEWGSFYNVINICNYVIHFAPSVCNVDPDYLVSEMKANVSEARALRALCYFYLIRTFDKVPLILTPTIDDTKDLNVAQSTQDEVLVAIIEDLQYAATNARSAYPQARETKYRITRKAAYAMLADVYLWQASGTPYPQDSIIYEKAIAACNQVYDTDKTDVSSPDGSAAYTHYALWDGKGSFYRIFENLSYPSSEMIFGLYADLDICGEQKSDNSGSLVAINKMYGSNSPSSGTRGDLNTTYLVANNSKYPQVAATSADFTSTEAAFAVTDPAQETQQDIRWQESAKESGDSYIVEKYVYLGGLSNYPVWIFYRVADIYLMKAEAMAEKMNHAQYETNPETGVKNLVYLNQVAQPEAYADTMRKAFKLCQAIFNRANSMAALKTAYAAYGSEDEGNTKISDITDLVYAERRREFLFEGKRWFDLLRLARRNYKRDPSTATTVVINSVKTKLDEGADLIGSRLASMDALYWPIYTKELDRNPSLKQNPYYLATEESDDLEK